MAVLVLVVDDNGQVIGSRKESQSRVSTFTSAYGGNSGATSNFGAAQLVRQVLAQDLVKSSTVLTEEQKAAIVGQVGLVQPADLLKIERGTAANIDAGTGPVAVAPVTDDKPKTKPLFAVFIDP